MSKTYTFVGNGFTGKPGFFPREQCLQLMRTALATRDLRTIFVSEEEFRANPVQKGTNPRPGRNLLEKMDTNFIFSSRDFQGEMQRVLGNHWRVLDYKFVMGVPDSYVPEWLRQELQGRMVANLGAYVKEEFRDITYFRGIDFHQDIIDFPDRDSDFITAYIYLDDVGAHSSPLYVIPDSHRFGATVFPHDLSNHGDSTFTYRDANGNSDEFELHKLTGAGGTLYYWHADTLHGTQPHKDDAPRISVRILVEKNSKADQGCELDRLNATIQGPLSLTQTRKDLDEKGKAVMAGNTINQVRK
jgi:hypothetical protein